MTDLETSGVYPIEWIRGEDGITTPRPYHEIIEIGLILFHPTTFAVIDTLDVKVKPVRMHLASPEALKVNGYREEDWVHAVPLGEAMERYAALTKDSVFWAWNATFDWSFISNAFSEVGVANQMDYRRFDLMSAAYRELKKRELKPSFKQSFVAELLGVPKEPEVHRAINGANVAYQIYQKLMG